MMYLPSATGASSMCFNQYDSGITVRVTQCHTVLLITGSNIIEANWHLA